MTWHPPREARIEATVEIGEEHELHLRARWRRGLRATYLQPGEPDGIEDLEIGRVQEDGTVRWEPVEEDRLGEAGLEPWQVAAVERVLDEEIRGATEPPED